MKHYLALIVIICMLIGYGIESYAAEAVQVTEDVDRMYDVLKSEGADLLQYEVTIREAVSQHEIQEVLTSLETHGHISKEISENAAKFVVHTPHKQFAAVERILLVVPTDKAYQAEIVYTVSGSEWTDKAQAFVQDLTAEAESRYFTSSAKKFACLKAGFGDKISEDILFQNVMKKLDVQQLTNTEDNVYTTTTGYTTQLKASHSLADNMNVQLALHEGNGQSTVTVGTPIITTEY
ncbi:YwmB family TATA-box binding protein [Terribacillus sp. DMT04]|uniref:YwmB family TATA-box binding protein n=1 Tax=Terribacillus sp. DMT04 TaxID=2850441 RepID=UPI001C2CC430|nr:YwmB family TATA-box binding protein [Terribacillus sp. DMT04]QXE01147.1 YwmB family TATA-box binding protein [Terribacillus sp. DMT04]